MSSKYHVDIRETPARKVPVAKFTSIEFDGCLGCLKCVKRESCVYHVYEKRTFNTRQVVDTSGTMCVNCMRCVQECKKNIISRAKNPEYTLIGNGHWRPDLLSVIWKQAETGKIPISGAGYRGPFTGTGFDSIWTDMSEIVRPTRDGIHGREYISTLIELGGRPAELEFSADGKLLTANDRFVELPVPMIIDFPPFGFLGETTRLAMARAAEALGTVMVATAEEVVGALSRYRDRLVVRYDPVLCTPDLLRKLRMLELPFSGSTKKLATQVKQANPGLIISVRLPLDEHAAGNALELARAGIDIIHIQASNVAQGLGRKRQEFAPTLVREVHAKLLEGAIRDRVTLIYSGGIAMAEHVTKTIICGADGVGMDTVLLVALECRVCGDCSGRLSCPAGIDQVPVNHGSQRIINLFGAWHAQLIELMGAMGIREVRRLRGELGRAMFFTDLERENNAPIFGKRNKGAVECSAEIRPRNSGGAMECFPVDHKLVKETPSRFRNQFGKFRVVRTSACIACGKCAEVCEYGVHRKAGTRMLAPRSQFCRGTEVCRKAGRFCGDSCPVDALRVGPNPAWGTFGDPRWTADLLTATWIQAETGAPPEHDIESRVGESGGGFDRIDMVIPRKAPANAPRLEDIDLTTPLNRRGDGRPLVDIGMPIYGGGMSFGSISLSTMLARARAYTAFNSFTCSGEGGFPKELEEFSDNVITQIATGLFGVREETIQRVKMVEFKYAQGAKPGLGGHLLGDKVTPAVAAIREAVVGTTLFSPFPFHSVYSVEDHKKHVDWIKEINPKALISVKVSTPNDVDMVAVGSYYAGAHVIHLDGSYGGTGAAPDIAKKNIAMPIEYAIPKVHRFLAEEGVREEMTLVASGGIRTAWDVAKAIALGADAVVIGTAEMVALECIRCAACESGRGCPRGIATTDPILARTMELDWATQRLINLHASWTVQLKSILRMFGMTNIRELVGRSDLLTHIDYTQDEAGRKRAKALAGGKR